MQRISLLLLITASVIIGLCSTCKDRNCPNPLIYHIPASLYPAKDTFNLGDTIWVEMNFPDNMTDQAGGIENTFTDFDFRLVISTLRVDTSHVQDYFNQYYSFISTIGRDSMLVTQSGATFFFFPEYKNQTYAYKVALITKAKGSFLFGMGSWNFRDNPITFKGNCDSRAIYFQCRLNNDAENNLTDLIDLKHPDLRSRNLEELHESGGYYFVVR